MEDKFLKDFSKIADCKFAYTPLLDQVGNPLVFFVENIVFDIDLCYTITAPNGALG